MCPADASGPAGDAAGDVEWLDDPRDHITHAWRDDTEHASRSLCGRDSIYAALTEPEDEYGHCRRCEVALAIEEGIELAARIPQDEDVDT